MPTRIAITGFGAFGASSAAPVEVNPSREVAFALEHEPPRGVDVVALELAVSFERAPRELAAWLASLAPRPDALLALGVQSRGGVYRLERRARGRLDDPRTDNDGVDASRATRDLAGELETDLDLARMEAALRAGGAHAVRRSGEAGGYVCERVYHALLVHGRELGVPALFLHLPTIAEAPVEAQTRAVRALVGELAREALARAGR